EVGVPVLVSTTPAKGATAVALDAKVIFVFDQPMTPNPQIGGVPPFVKGAIAWTGAGLSANKFSYAWSADGKTLTCTYTGSLPGSATIGWELNPADALFTLDSAEGDPLPSGLYQGSFTTAAGGGPDPVDCNAGEIPDSWGSYSMNKGAAYQQTSAADPVPGLDNPFTAGAFINSGQGGAAVTAGSLTFPGGAVKTLEGLFGTFFVGDEYATEAAMEAAYPPGAYTLKFTRTGEAQQSIAMTVPANTIPVPKIANYVEAQSIDPAQPFTLRWNAFTGASNPHDFLHLTIMDGTKVLFQAPDLCVPRELAVTATSIAIPAGTFQLGKTYNATLSFSREFYYSTNAVPNMGGFASLGRTTDFSLTATGGVTPAAPARFVEFRRLPNGHPQMVLTGTPSRGYTLERAGNLSAPVWRDAGTVTMDAAGRGSFEDAQAGTLFPLFYRARAN
ncbi:MAG: Ig-like domain-containing protein, partial [Verrucomicrobiales bacterium]|nr:Ig-like domain-containing protein [Verrucomicrobiales bacterium]